MVSFRVFPGYLRRHCSGFGPSRGARRLIQNLIHVLPDGALLAGGLGIPQATPYMMFPARIHRLHSPSMESFFLNDFDFRVFGVFRGIASEPDPPFPSA